jgi:hypothetical protein
MARRHLRERPRISRRSGETGSRRQERARPRRVRGAVDPWLPACWTSCRSTLCGSCSGRAAGSSSISGPSGKHWSRSEWYRVATPCTCAIASDADVRDRGSASTGSASDPVTRRPDRPRVRSTRCRGRSGRRRRGIPYPLPALSGRSQASQRPLTPEPASHTIREPSPWCRTFGYPSCMETSTRLSVTSTCAGRRKRTVAWRVRRWQSRRCLA